MTALTNTADSAESSHPDRTAAGATLPVPKEDNRWRRGLRHGLRTRRLPFAGGRSIEKHRNAYRRAIEDELQAQGREVGPSEATHVAAAVAWYEHAAKAGFWLANNHDELSHDQRLAFSREEARGLSEASKVLKSLGIDRDKQEINAWGKVKLIEAGR